MSFYRFTVWFTKGYMEYTKSGYEKAAKNFQPKALETDLTGKVCIVTGANSGIGKTVALEYAKRGGTVCMLCRNKQRGEEAMNEIKTETKNENLHLFVVDIGRPKQIKEFIAEFEKTGLKPNVLVNNAGCMVQKRTETEEGFESNFAANTLGTFYLTQLLIEKLKLVENSRVVTVSSGGMLTTKLDYKDLQFKKLKPFDGTMCYAQNKRQQVELTDEWASRHPEIKFFSCHPGWADTPAVRSSMPEFYEKMKDNLRTAEQGADTVVYLAISPGADKLENGSFIQDRTPVSKHLPLAWTHSSKKDSQALFSALEDLLKPFDN